MDSVRLPEIVLSDYKNITYNESPHNVIIFDGNFKMSSLSCRALTTLKLSEESANIDKTRVQLKRVLQETAKQQKNSIKFYESEQTRTK